jgi:hypothetical protein
MLAIGYDYEQRMANAKHIGAGRNEVGTMSSIIFKAHTI